QRGHGDRRRAGDAPAAWRQRHPRRISGDAAPREPRIGVHLRGHPRRPHAHPRAGDHRAERVQRMKIAVCIKRVADSETRVRVAADGTSLDEAGVKFILNPYDEFAVEEALRRKERAGSGEVVVIALGPAAAQETIRTALAMGADRGILLQADRIPTDGLEVAKALAAELK